MRRPSSSPSSDSLSIPQELMRRRGAAAGADLSLLWMFLAGALAMALAAAASGQEPPSPPRFQGEVTVSEVLLDVLVTDREGNVILGLRPGDFRVTEGGEPVEIADVTFYSNRRYLGSAAAAAAGIDPDQVPDRRYFVLLFDDQRRNEAEARGVLQRQLAAARDAERWLERELQPGDRVAVASWDVKLKLHADFTGEREELVAAVRAAARGAEGRADWPSRRGSGEEPALATRLPAGKELRDATSTIYEALQTLADAAAPIRGRKNLVLFSTGFGEIGAFGLYARDYRYHRETIEALNDANVAIYSIDLVPPGWRHPLSESLNDFAQATGGRFYHDVVAFGVPLEQISEITNGYYLLAYRAEHDAGEQGYREVEVETVNPEFRVTARRGYRFGD